MLALVGPSGGGKSTVANLLSRFWDVKQGQILVRGSDIRDIPLSDLMDQISMVFQRVYLFQDTVYNLSLIHISEPEGPTKAMRLPAGMVREMLWRISLSWAYPKET